LGAATFPAPLRAQQSGRLARVARLSPLTEAAEQPMIDALRAGLRELGWVEGQNLTLELRFGEGQLDRLPALAERLVRDEVDVIVTGSTPGALAAKRATSRIAIVFVTTGDPIAGGLVQSLGRPGGNLTGVTALGIELNAKRLELLKEAFPRARRIAVLTNPDSSYTGDFETSKEPIARGLGLHLVTGAARTPDDLPKTFEDLGTLHPDALLVLSDVMFISYRARVVQLADTYRLPAIYPDRAFVDAGGLMFYGAGLPDMYRHAALYVDKVLRGAKPGELPVEQPTTFQLVVNMQCAKASGFDIPATLLARADEVIE
jgi:putative ABC transport system substrate-binding protein